MNNDYTFRLLRNLTHKLQIEFYEVAEMHAHGLNSIVFECAFADAALQCASAMACRGIGKRIFLDKCKAYFDESESARSSESKDIPQQSAYNVCYTDEGNNTVHLLEKLKMRLNDLAEVGEVGSKNRPLQLCHHCDTRLLPQTQRIVRDDIVWCWRCWMKKPLD